MKKTAVLLDLGFVLHKLYALLGNRAATAAEIREFAERCINPTEEELFRIYCYHCTPYGEVQTHPLTKQRIDFAATPTYIGMNNLLRELSLTDNVAFRAGELSFDGWVIKKRSAEEITRTGRPLQGSDFAPDLKQKRVDMKIGLDVAWLASRQIVDRIILVTADSDFVPAMKFGRREGVQVILVTLSHRQVKHDLLVHADEVRSVAYP
ncbi:NYN domain-containing protein [Longimicrobium sp.]|uniref:NYN domain-containing protein n=1 Tax=Longimicrobium sp. TaxID=2029185 RepID=UPI002E3816CA|nr:NYN domain-containing protein [Longimicrobium sp.]HEX6039297.1 NYN domain-containing protein [Longimicrobium sp.]